MAEYRVSSGMCVNLSIQSKCGKTWTLQILHSDTFHSVHVLTSYPLSANPAKWSIIVCIYSIMEL